MRVSFTALWICAWMALNSNAQAAASDLATLERKIIGELDLDDADRAVWRRLSAENLASWAKHREVELRQRAALDPMTPATSLAALAADTDATVVRYVASNPNLPMTSILQLAKKAVQQAQGGDDRDLFSALMDNPNTPAQALRELAKVSYSQESLSSHPNTPLDLLVQAVSFDIPYDPGDWEYEEYQKLKSLQKNPKELLDFMLASEQYSLRSAALDNRATSAAQLRAAVAVCDQLEDDYGLESIAKNPSAPDDVLQLLWQRPEAQFANEVLANPSCPNKYIELALQSLDDNVFEQGYAAWRRCFQSPVPALKRSIAVAAQAPAPALKIGPQQVRFYANTESELYSEAIELRIDDNIVATLKTSQDKPYSAQAQFELPLGVQTLQVQIDALARDKKQRIQASENFQVISTATLKPYLDTLDAKLSPLALWDKLQGFSKALKLDPPKEPLLKVQLGAKASAEQLASAEKRLGFKLPPAYQTLVQTLGSYKIYSVSPATEDTEAEEELLLELYAPEQIKTVATLANIDVNNADSAEGKANFKRMQTDWVLGRFSGSGWIVQASAPNCADGSKPAFDAYLDSEELAYQDSDPYTDYFADSADCADETYKRLQFANAWGSDWLDHELVGIWLASNHLWLLRPDKHYGFSKTVDEHGQTQISLQ